MANVNFVVDALRRDGRYSFDDVVSLCSHVRREYGVELTLAQGRIVLNRLTGWLSA